MVSVKSRYRGVRQHLKQARAFFGKRFFQKKFRREKIVKDNYLKKRDKE